MKNAHELQYYMTKGELGGDQLVNMSKELILMWQQACVTLIAKLELDKIVVTSVLVKAMVTDDINMVKKNLKTLRGVEKLIDLNITDFCLN